MVKSKSIWSHRRTRHTSQMWFELVTGLKAKPKVKLGNNEHWYKRNCMVIGILFPEAFWFFEPIRLKILTNKLKRLGIRTWEFIEFCGKQLNNLSISEQIYIYSLIPNVLNNKILMTNITFYFPLRTKKNHHFSICFNSIS